MKHRTGMRAAFALGLTLTLVMSACGDDEGETATVAFSEPQDGASVSGPVSVAMTADGIAIEKAGEAHAGAGHFHVIADAGCVEAGAAVPRDADHVHFGGGQSEGTIYLAPGPHELCLQAADGVHVALDATDTRHVTVGIDDIEQWCAVVAEVDDLFAATDTSGDDFAVRQVGYENVRRLLLQLEDGIELVDEVAREDVRTTVGFAMTITDAFISAPDEAAAEEALDTIFSGVESDVEPAAPWIASRCGVDIDG